jgi:hypothetical protein
MTKRNKIIYSVATLWLALGMTSTGIVQIIGLPEEIQMIIGLGFPAYIVTFLGVCKLLGVVAILIPGWALLKEWAYAGFFFNMAGAIYSHAMMGSAGGEFFGPSLLIVLIALSWQFRPASRKVVDPATVEAKPETVLS